MTEKAYILAGLFSRHTNNHTQAKEYIQKAIQLNPSSVSGNVCLGYLNMDSKKNTTYFDNALEKSMRDIEGMFGKCILKKMTRDHSEALDLANRLIAYHPAFIPAYVERLKILLETQSWELLLEGAQRLGGISNDNIDAFTMICIHELCFEGPSPTVATFINTLQKVLFN
jgi:tetratricopeptide repeat protein 21B